MIARFTIQELVALTFHRTVWQSRWGRCLCILVNVGVKVTLICILEITDKQEQEKKMISLLGSLPDSNYYTMMAILDHLVR